MEPNLEEQCAWLAINLLRIEETCCPLGWYRYSLNDGSDPDCPVDEYPKIWHDMVVKFEHDVSGKNRLKAIATWMLTGNAMLEIIDAMLACEMPVALHTVNWEYTLPYVCQFEKADEVVVIKHDGNSLPEAVVRSAYHQLTYNG